MQEFKKKNSNREIMENECDSLALIFSGLMDVINIAKKELTDIQAKQKFQKSAKEGEKGPD